VSRLLAGWGVRIAIIAAIAGGAFIFRDRIAGDAGDLKVGDCFDDPVGVVEVSEIQHHPCNEPHTGEVVFVGTMEGTNEEYPSDDVLRDYVGANCIPAFNAYTGLSYETAQDLDVGTYSQTEEGWRAGDRGIICYIVRVDGGPMNQSVKAAE
jgi:Septum formation